MRSCGLVLVAGAVLLAATHSLASPPPSRSQVDTNVYEKTVGAAVEYLRLKGQSDDGSYSSYAGTGVTSLVTAALLRHGRTPQDPQVARSLDYLRQLVQPDGGIYQPGTLYRNYETCLAILCFSEANVDGRCDRLIERADAFVKGLQWDEDEGKDPSDLAFGGGGYGKHKRPDLSNTGFLIDALRAAGNGADSDAVQRALIFISRCQNLETEHNTTPFAVKNPDGGFYYTPAAGGSSQAGETADGGLRSYGSMTYAGLKSMLYAGVGPDDPRVKAAIEWIRKHYDLNTNPGMSDAGLYYYYHLFAKALDATSHDVLFDEHGRAHDWRAELVAELSKRQQPDGSWTNENARWLEGDPNLVTGYALLALAYCKPHAQE
ncbi:MAG: terpene cyclase/mutase family protein [Pirellulaceae bacterium]|nr:terpene cyclase/mutase family protein [Pirellulaceae bacterium]